MPLGANYQASASSRLQSFALDSKISLMSSVSASAVLIGMVLYVGIAGSPLVGATLLFLFSLGMGVPLILAVQSRLPVTRSF